LLSNLQPEFSSVVTGKRRVLAKPDIDVIHYANHAPGGSRTSLARPIDRS